MSERNHLPGHWHEFKRWLKAHFGRIAVVVIPAAILAVAYALGWLS